MGAPPGAAPISSEPARRLLAVEAREAGAGALVHLRADGSVGSAESFTLENPDRLVVDLPGLASDVATPRIELGSPHAQRIRVGQHDDMVRVVIDAGSAAQPFEGRRLLPAASGLVVALGSGEELELAVQDALGGAPMLASGSGPAPEEPAAADAALAAQDGAPAESDDWMMTPADAEAAPEASGPEATETASAADAAPAAGAGPVTIYGVEFDSQDGRDRVVVLGERPVDYLLYEPSPDTVILSIQNAVIDPEVAVRITPEPGGPVSLVTAFEQPETEGSEVRVVMTRADDLKPEVSRRGSLIVVDFPRDGRIAAAPPVLNAQPGQAAGAPESIPSQPAEQYLSGPNAVPAVATAASAGGAAAAPASLEPVPAIEVLQEGGLLDGKEYGGRRISLDFKDIDMSDVLRLVAEVSDLNVIAGEEVKGKVTIRLVDIPWDQALDVILLTKGLGFVRVGNVLRIAPKQVLKQEEEMRLQERRALEQLQDLVVKLQPVNYAEVGAVKGMVQRLLTPRGTVDTDKRTNTLIIKDIPSVIDEATALVKAIDTQTPQVLIEAKIVEASLDFSREFGVVWGVGVQPLTDAFDPSSPERQDLGSDAFRLNTTSDIGNNASFMNPLTAGPTGLFNIAGFLLDEKLNLDLQLQAAEVNGDGKVISSPRVVTLDNNKATIEQGVSIPFQTFENGDAQLEFVDAVLKLDVTPHITADKSIIMSVKVSRNAPDDSVFTLTGSPAIAKNQVDTETLVKDGQTLVIGGIYVVDKSQRQSRVPYLHNIPMLGSLFRNDEMSDSRKELLIFVTPRIVITPQAAS
jgi:type IV pilus assembly protein PilQ